MKRIPWLIILLSSTLWGQVGGTAPPSGNFPSGPFSEMKVQTEPHQLFYDPFDSSGSLDTTNRWNAPVSGGGGVGAACCTNGFLTLGSGTTVNGYSYLTSSPSFRSSTPGWIRFAHNIALEASTLTNAERAWGVCSPQAVPTAANPIANGSVFEVFTDGKLYASIYNASVRSVVAALNVPSDGVTHNYQIYDRPTNDYWYIDGVLVATSSLLQSAYSTETLPNCYLDVANTGTAPTSSAVLTSNATSVSDTAANGTTLNDATYQWRGAKVDNLGNLSVAMSTGANPCFAGGSTIQSISGATSGTVAVQLIALSGSTKIYVCSVAITGVSGTAPTFSLQYGTGAACATAPVVLLGPLATTTAGSVYYFGPQLGATTAGQELCYLDGGTIPVQNYTLTYVQQ